MSSKRNLLEKYEIPITHLDYGYIDECTNVKELEKIVMILRSGEEGYFPDLTKRAEEKLKSLKPQSKILRTEYTVLTKGGFTPTEWKEINEPVVEWVNELRSREKVLKSLPDDEKDNELNIPPVRVVTTKITSTVTEHNEPEAKPKPCNRIKSTEYNKWDKYDADTEELKIDLAEERAREEIERQNRINLRRKDESEKIPISENDLSKFTDVEKENLAMKYKDRGNEYFRAKEFSEAIWEYTQYIKILPESVHGYNNRALAYIKINDFKQCIEDCNICLDIDPKNLKGLLRKAQAYLGLDRRREAYEVYLKVISIESNNTTAKNQIEDLQKQLPGLAPVSATRIQIIEEDSTKDAAPLRIVKKNEKNEKSPPNTERHTNNHTKSSPSNLEKDYDFSKLIVPNRIVKSKLSTAVETLGHIQKETKTNIQKIAQKAAAEPKPEVDIFKQMPNKSQNVVLIEEL